MDDLLAEFVAETREMLAAIEGELVAWEADPADRTRLDAIFRFVHTVKGNCGFFDFPRLEQLSHAAESALADVRAGRRPAGAHLVDAVLAVIDRITQLIGAIEAGEQLPQGSDELLIAALAPDHDAETPADGTTPEPLQDRRPVASSATARSVRLPIDLLDRLMSGISDMVLARNDLSRRLRDAGSQLAIDGPFERLSAIVDDVREGVTRMRMQRIEYLYNALPRLVRDLSTELGKQVTIELHGGDVELDREMIEIVRDPLTHIIRNAIDHGIEPPGERRSSGKREAGLLTVSARQAGNKILLAIADDGRGLDVARIAGKAIAQGIATQAEIEAMSPDQRLALIFEPGLSTAETVSEVSGRGVGMDVVRANLEKVGGAIRVKSEAGEGAMFVLELPLTLSIIAGLTVTSGAHRYAIPRSFIEEIARGNSAAIEVEQLGDTGFVTFRGKRVPAIGLDQVLGQGAAPLPRSGVYVFVRLPAGDVFALVVDRVLDNEDLVVKPLAPAVMAIGVYAGTTLLGDGYPILMLDIPGIAARHQLANLARKRRAATPEVKDTGIASRCEPVILYTDMAGRRRAVRMSAVVRIQRLDRAAIVREGTECRAAVDGAILPLVGFDDSTPGQGELAAIWLSDGTSELLVAARAVDNSAELTGSPLPIAGDTLLEGTALIDGEITAIIDSHALFARHAGHTRAEQWRTCRLPEGDGWATSFLRPLLESAGYQIVAPGSDIPVDLAIACDGDPVSPSPSARVLRIRSSIEPAGANDSSVYRYDRAALYAALAGEK